MRRVAQRQLEINLLTEGFVCFCEKGSDKVRMSGMFEVMSEVE